MSWLWDSNPRPADYKAGKTRFVTNLNHRNQLLYICLQRYKYRVIMAEVDSEVMIFLPLCHTKKHEFPFTFLQ